MTRITVDQALRAKLNGLKEELELYDESGQPLGHFLPPEQYRALVYATANAQISDEELERRFQEPGGRTLAEIWTDLGRQ